MNLQLKQIDISKNIADGGHESCKHPDIKIKTNYIAVIYGHLHIGHFSEQWYGWNFGPWINGVGVQLNGLESLYEILNPESLDNFGKYIPPPVSKDEDEDEDEDEEY